MQIQKISRRIVVLAFLIIMVLTLVACGKSEAAQSVDNMISALEIVDENSRTAIEEAEAAYNSLTDKEKRTLENYTQLEEARSTFDELMAYQAINAIDWIGFIDENSLDAIQNARRIYDALTDAEKRLVSNYSILTSAEEEFINIKIAPVEELITQIPSFNSSGDTLPDGFANAVELATEAYEGLDEELKRKVSNHDDLTSAITYLSDYRVNSLIAYIDENFSEIDFSSGANLVVANTAYDLLSDADKARITNYDMMKTAQDKFDGLSPIQLKSYSLSKDIIGQPTIKINATNISDNTIKEFSMCIFSYDSDGIPVKVYFNDFSSMLRYSNALRPEEATKASSYWQLYGDYSEMKQFVVILNRVEFYDGTVWENSQYSTLFDKYNETLLSADDENILPKA